MKVTPPEGDSVTSSVLVKAVETLKFLTATGGALVIKVGTPWFAIVAYSYLLWGSPKSIIHLWLVC